MGLPKILPTYGLAVVLLASITTASQNATCYYPNGSPVSGYVPCKDLSTNGVTYCCSSSSVCTTGGYCLGNAGVFYRGGCTDHTWTSSLCPILCATGAILLEHAWLILTNLLTKCLSAILNNFANFYPCNAGIFSHNNWVCGDPSQPSTNFCDTASFNSSFTFDPGAPFVPQVEAVTATSTVTTISSVTAYPSSTATASTLPNADSCPTHKGTIIGLGVGLGLGLGLLSIATFACFLVERRRRMSAEKDASEAQASGFYQSNLKGDPNSKTAHEAGSQMLHEIGHSHRSS